ncbi:hypothetical protein M758_8G067000 [Ceratodon purpureus]|nr:hypothetical protein M758_8G067000 [Ceratodon purpureus]
MGKFAGLLALVGLWMLLAGGSEAISITQIQPSTLYIVQVDHTVSNSKNSLQAASGIYSQLLLAVKQEANILPSHESLPQPLHIFNTVLRGFTAVLTPTEAEVLKSMKGVLGVFPDRVRYPHTTHTPEFLSLSTTSGLWPASAYGDGVIVGVLDTGVWPEGESFSDKGMGPIPSRWKGMCDTGNAQDFNASHCNRKIIGARYYSTGYEQARGKMNDTLESRSPRDTEGHGTHTASTAAGSAVKNANLNGLASGTARGMATKARIAVYKICWEDGCYDSDILAAFDQAVKDGVDVISLSVGGGVVPYYEDAIAIGSFGAMKKGIFVSCSAGNSGPGPMSVSNIAPWVITVGASTLDRKFPANVVLGNGTALEGVSLVRGTPKDENVTALVFGGDVASKNASDGSQCLTDSLNPALVKGKIVVCIRGGNGRVAKGAVVKEAGGFGMVLANAPTDGEGLLADSHILPATLVGAKAGAIILDYIKSTTKPVANFKFGGTQLGVKPAPVVASFSSRGPNSLTPEVLKPDITGPGVNILAAWTGRVGPSGLSFDPRRVKFNIISGTSMSCPHISGLGALLKGAHPDWSPAAIKSAMMTTATIMDNRNGILTDEATTTEATPFEYGSGHVRPEKALDPGLIYDMDEQDHVNFLCSLPGYTSKRIAIFTGDSSLFQCPLIPPKIEDMNYPSFSAVFKKPLLLLPVSTTFKREVTNVAKGKSTYKATVLAPDDVTITVEPSELSFTEVNEKKSFTLTVTTYKSPIKAMADTSTTQFGYLSWSDGTHVVQSPIAVTVQQY